MARRAVMTLPSGAEISCSIGYIDESCGVWPRLATMLARQRAASGIETEGHDGETRHGAKHESPAPKGDAQP